MVKNVKLTKGELVDVLHAAKTPKERNKAVPSKREPWVRGILEQCTV